jgi:hypothetical protein
LAHAKGPLWAFPLAQSKAKMLALQSETARVDKMGQARDEVLARK